MRAFAALAAALPPGAMWLTSQLSRTVDTARAIGAGGYARLRNWPPMPVSANKISVSGMA